MATDQERAEFEALIASKWPSVIPLWQESKGNYFDDKVRKLWWLWQAARRAPAAPVQVFSHMEARPKHNSFSNEPMRAVAVDTMGREMPHYDPSRAALPPPDAAQSNSAEFDGIKTKAAAVQLPEPDAWRYIDARSHFRYRGRRVGFAAEYPLLKPEPLYSEQQVRQLLAAHGIDNT